jgi:hypothetical protein
VTPRAVTGLLLFDLALALAGLALLFGIRGFHTWRDVLRLAGIGYLLGFAALSVVLTAILAAGVPFGAVTVVAALALLAGGGLVGGVATSRPRPAALRGAGLPALSLAGAFFVAAFALYFEALFRATRLQGLSEWDAWRCWGLRPKAIWFFDGFDPTLFGPGAPRCSGYPPGLATVEASSFEAMGSPDVVTYSLQSWVLALAFLGAVAGLLGRRVRPLLLLPFLLLAILLPSFTDRVADGRADLPLAFLVVVAALLVCLWLEDARLWRLAAATGLLGGAMLAKREGLLLVVCVLGAAVVASLRERRFAWPRLAAVGAASFLLALPWRLWLAFESAPSGAPPGGYLDALHHLDRVWPSLRLVARTAFDYDLWLVAVPLAIAAAVLALAAGSFRVPAFLLAFAGLALAACTWAIWAEPDLEITQDFGLNPVVRLVGGPVLLLVALTPLALERAWHRTDAGLAAGRSASWPVWRAAAPWAVVALVALAYPLAGVAGISSFRLPGGPPRFPSPDECVVPVRSGEPVRLVVGYAGSYAEASLLRARAAAAGVAGTVAAPDGCGRVRVALDEPDTRDAADKVARLRAAGLEPTVEGLPAP